MPAAFKLVLSAEQRSELQQARDHHARPYVRERAAALLKIAEGISIRQVSDQGLLRHRRRDTVSGWVHRYLAEGLEGLLVRKGRGRKPAFSPLG